MRILEVTLKQLETKKNESEEKLLELQLEGAAAEIELRNTSTTSAFTSASEIQKDIPVCVCDSTTNTDGNENEYDEFYVRELEERCSSYQNELFLIRNELMTLQHQTDELEESGAKLEDDIMNILHTCFYLDGEQVLSVMKLKRRENSDENGLILSSLKQLAILWKDLVEKKGVLERAVTKLSSQKQNISLDSSGEEHNQESSTISPVTSSNLVNLDAFIPSKIDSFGLETILEEERNDDESRSDSCSPGGPERIVSTQRTPSLSPSPAPLSVSVTTSVSSQTDSREDDDSQAALITQVQSLQLHASKLLVRENELLAIIEDKDVQISRLELELQRLRTHLVETEDQFTMETVASEEKIKQLESELSLLKKEYSQALLNNAPSEDVREEIVRITGERNEAWAQTSSYQEQTQKLTTQLQNLHFVLEQFQKEKEAEIGGIERRCRSDMNQLEEKNQALRKELEKQESLLEKAKSGLDAAQQLNAQIEERTRTIASLKAQVQERDAELSKLKSQMEDVAKNLDGKIDRYLVKNLIVGYFSTPADKKKEVLRVLATVLDFNREDRQKTSLESAPIWPFSKGEPSATTGHDNQSLSQAFIHFLESESQPKVELRIPPEEMTRRISIQSSGSSSVVGAGASSTSTPLFSGVSPTLTNSSPPLNVSEMFMSNPVLSQVDHSNSILKDVLNPKP
jgi:hypothetical protein